MRRRTFIHRCSMLAAGTIFATTLTAPHSSLIAAGVSAQSATQMTKSDRALLRMLSAYTTDAYFWGSQVFARATGVRASSGTTNLLVQVGDYSRLVAFLRSEQVKPLGKISVVKNTLSFTYQGAAYTVTNEDADGFSRAVAGGGVARDHMTAIGTFAHQRMLYHPATDQLSDPHLAVENNRLDLVEMPAGGLKTRVQTLLQGWLEARRQSLDFGASFDAFQSDLLNIQPTKKAASQVALPLLGHLSELAGMYNVDELGSLLLTPLVSASLQDALGLDAGQIVAEAKVLRADAATASYPDAAIWLATLLPSQIEAGVADEWLNSTDDDAAANAATRAALPLAKQLVKTLTFEAH